MGKGAGLMVTPVTAGVRTDLETLFANFKGRRSLSYGAFESVWLEMKFPNIFRMRDTEQEMRELIEKLLVLALGYALESKDLGTQCCALAAVYGVYHTQPQLSLTKINVTRESLLKLYALMETLKKEGLKEFLFIVHTLFKDRAFHVCLFADEYNPLTHKAYDNQADSLEAEEQTSACAGRLNADVVGELVKDDTVAELDDLHNYYTAHKDKLLASYPGSHPAAKNISIVKNSLAAFIHEVAEDAEDKSKRRQGKRREERGGAEEDEASATVKSRRSQLKEKAYGGVASQARHRRHRQEAGNRASLPSEVDFEHDEVSDILERAFAVPTAPAPKKRGRKRNIDGVDGDKGEPKAKRKPGRPKKEPGAHKEPKDEPSEAHVDEELITAKKTGRPAKVKAPVRKPKEPKPPKEPKAPKEPKEKKPRGRPRVAVAVASSSKHDLEEL